MCELLPFGSHPGVNVYRHPYKIYLEKNPFSETANPEPVKVPISWIIVGALTFHPTSDPPRILLIQRSASDTMPHRWEIPGGGCDEDDASILHAVVRELDEETGLLPRIVGPAVGQGYVFQLGLGKWTRKLNFIVEIDATAGGSIDVKLDPDEHQAFVWATENEIRQGKIGDLDIVFTSEPQKEVLVEAFEVRGRGANGRELGNDAPASHVL